MGKITLNKKLKSYSALAVSALAASSSADAQIKYTDIDIDGDGTNDVAIRNGYQIGATGTYYGYGYVQATYFALAQVSYYAGLAQYGGVPAALSSGASIGSSIATGNSGSQTLAIGYSRYFFGYGLFNNGYAGNWPNATDKYLGVRFKIGANTHYGWIRMTIANNGNPTVIKDMAYNTCVDASIQAGQKPVAPTVINLESSALSFTHGGGAIAITSALNLSLDAANCSGIDSARVKITGGYINGEDVLAFTPVGNITGSFDATNGEIIMRGNDTKANYEAAMLSVTYDNTAVSCPNTGNRTMEFVFVEAVSNTISNQPTRDVTISYTSTAPVLASIEGTAVSYVAPGSATAITAALTLSDDCTDIASASVQITSNYVNGEDVLAFSNTGTITGTFDASSGTMNLAGTDTKANYEAALRAVTYQNSTGATFNVRTATFTANDGTSASNTQTRDIDVVVGVKEFDLSSSLQISPNPAKEIVTIKFDNTVKGNITIRVTDVTGRVVMSQSANKSAQLFNQSFDISSLENGIYLMNIITENGKATSRIVKQ